MHLLALETATAELSVALFRDGSLYLERSAGIGPAAETLMPTIDEVLKAGGLSARELDAFAVSIGPGSFTSLRVGIATAKGLAFGGEGRIAPVSTLEVLAAPRLAPGQTTLAVLDARRGEVYAAAWRGDLSVRVIDEGVYTPEELVSRLEHSEPVECVGEGVIVCGPALREQLADRVTLRPPPEGVPRARDVGRLGHAALSQGGGVRAEALVPHYVRRAEAEVKRTGQRFEAPGGREGSSL